MRYWFYKLNSISRGAFGLACVIIGVFTICFSASGLLGDIGEGGGGEDEDEGGAEVIDTSWPGPLAPAGDIGTIDHILDFDDLVDRTTTTTQLVEGPLWISTDGTFPSILGYDGTTMKTALGDATFVSSWHDVDIGADGLPFITSCSDEGGLIPNEIRVVKCQDAACERDPVSRSFAESGVTQSKSCQTVILSDSLPLIAYRGVVGGTSRLKTTKCTKSSCSGVRTESSHDTAAAIGTVLDVASGPDMKPVISYQRTGGGGGARLAKCDDQTCSSTTIRTISTTGSDAAQSAIAVRSDNRAVMVYSSGTSVKIAICDTADCSSWTTGTIFTAGGFGASIGYLSLVIDRDDIPSVLIRSAGSSESNNKLWLHTCADALCSTGTSGPEYEIALPGGSTFGTGGGDVVLDSYDIPQIAMPLATSNKIRMISCADRMCESSADFILSDITPASPSVGTRVALGSDELPMVVFNNGSNILHVAKARTPGFATPALGVSVIGAGGNYEPWYVPPLIFGSDSDIGIYGYASGGTVRNYGVYGFSPTGSGVYGKSPTSGFGGGYYGGVFYGAVEVLDDDSFHQEVYGNVVIADGLDSAGPLTIASSTGTALAWTHTVPTPYTVLTGGGSDGDQPFSSGIMAASESNSGIVASGENYGIGLRGTSAHGYGLYAYAFGSGAGLKAESDASLLHVAGIVGAGAEAGVHGASDYLASGKFLSGASAESVPSGVGIFACGTESAGTFIGDVQFTEGLYGGIASQEYISSNNQIVGKRVIGDLPLTFSSLYAIVEKCKADGGCGSITLP